MVAEALVLRKKTLSIKLVFSTQLIIDSLMYYLQTPERVVEAYTWQKLTTELKRTSKSEQDRMSIYIVGIDQVPGETISKKRKKFEQLAKIYKNDKRVFILQFLSPLDKRESSLTSIESDTWKRLHQTINQRCFDEKTVRTA